MHGLPVLSSGSRANVIVKQTGGWCCWSWWPDSTALTAFSEVPDSIPGWGVCIYFPFLLKLQFQFPFLLSLPIPFRLTFRLLVKSTLRIFPKNIAADLTGCEIYHSFHHVKLIVIILASAPLHTQDTEIGLGALVWQPQPSFSISDRSCLMAEKSRQNASRIARQKMKTGCERHGERESESRREDRVTKLGRTRKTIRCYQSEQ